MRDTRMFGRLATAFASGFFVAAIVSSVAGSILSFGAPTFSKVILDFVNAGFGAIGIRVASAVGIEAILALAGGVSALLLARKHRVAAE